MPHQLAALIVQGHSAYNSLTAFNLELARALRALEVEPIVVDLTKPDRGNGTMNQVMQDYGPAKIISAFSFSGIGCDAGDTDPEGNIWQRLKIPFVTWFLDHPCYYLSRHMHPAPAILRLYAGRDFADFQRDYIKSPFRTAIMPFGTMSHGKEPGQRMPKQGETPLMIFAKSGGSPAAMEDKWQRLPHIMVRVIQNAIEHYWGTTTRSGNVVQSILTAADAAGIELRNDLPLFSFFIAQVDDYIRYRKSEIVFRELLKLPVTIYGFGFNHIDSAGAKAKVLPPVDSSVLMSQFHEALAVININPNADDGAQDRVYSAFGCGALPISDINQWWKGNCADLLPYSYDFHNRSVTAAVEKVLADPVAAAELAWQFGKTMRQEKNFPGNVAKLVEIALMHRSFTFNFKAPQENFVRFGA